LPRHCQSPASPNRTSGPFAIKFNRFLEASKRVRIAANGEEKIAWVADYHDQHRTRHLKTFKTQKAAKAWLVETQGEVACGVHTPERQSINVYEAAQLWLERARAEGLEKGTCKAYGVMVERHIGPTIGAFKLAQLSTPMLEGWRDRLLANNTRAPTRKILGAFKSISSEAQRRGLVAQNAALPVRVDAKKREQKKLEVGRNIPGKTEIQKLLAALNDAHWARHRPLFVTAIFTGMRASELRGLSWSAVDFEKKTVTVRQRADEWGTIGMPKSHAGQREIPMAPPVLNALKEWQLCCPKGELDLVFPNTIGKVRALSNIVNRVWHPLQTSAGLVDEKRQAVVQLPHPAPLRRLVDDRARVQPETAAGAIGSQFGADDLRPLRPPVPKPGGRPRAVHPWRNRAGGVGNNICCLR
jgi:integrase